MTISERLKLLKEAVNKIDQELPEVWMQVFATMLTEKKESLLRDIEILENFRDAKADDLPEKERHLKAVLPVLKTAYEVARQNLAETEAEIARLERLKQLLM